MSDYWVENGLVKPQQVVVCAANKLGDVILCGARHWDPIMHAQADQMPLLKFTRAEQGFINQFGEFLTREEAYEIVQKNGQPFNSERNCSTSKLYSEGLY